MPDNAAPDAEAKHPATLATDRLLGDCEIRRTRRRGPGGQHRNKVETAIEIVHTPTGVTAEASERRSQHQNRTVAIRRLRVQLALQVRFTPTSEPSELWRSRRQGQRLAIAVDHDDFPALLSEAMDATLHFSTEQEAAAHLGVTVSQLVKFLKREPAALERVNRQRRADNRRRLQ